LKYQLHLCSLSGSFLTVDKISLPHRLILFLYHATETVDLIIAFSQPTFLSRLDQFSLSYQPTTLSNLSFLISQTIANDGQF